MIELIDNFIQLAATAAGFIWTIVLFFKTHKQPLFLLACFYGVFNLSTLYWTLHLMLFGETPPVFYVSDIGWIASYAFLLTLLYTMRTPAKEKRKTAFCYLALVFCVPQIVLYITHGDVLFNLITDIPTMFIVWFSIEGLVFSKRNPEGKSALPFYVTVLCFGVLEFCLWTASCFWMGDTLLNPYFLFDILLSASMLMMLPKLKKAV